MAEAVRRRVALTGRGCVSSLGGSIAEFERALHEGRGGIVAVDPARYPGPLRLPVLAPVTGFDPLARFGEKRLAQLDPFAQFALGAAREAVAEAGVDPAALSSAAVLIGTGGGGQCTIDDEALGLYRDGARVHPLTVPRVMASSATSQIAIDFGCRGPAFGVTSACASATHAIGLAFQMVRAGLVDVALAGGAEAPLSYGSLRAWEALRVTATDTCRPFSRGRTGMVLGEGGGVFVLEAWEAARARGASVLAEIVGFGATADAGDLVHPDPAGMAAAMRAALADGGLRLEDVDHVNAHGTGTATNDACETRALHDVFGPHARRLAISATKSAHGHTLGAAGAIELAATVFALRAGFVPATLNYTAPDPACDLDCTPNAGRARELRCALSNSFAFGGLNAVLAVRSV